MTEPAPSPVPMPVPTPVPVPVTSAGPTPAPVPVDSSVDVSGLPTPSQPSIDAPPVYDEPTPAPLPAPAVPTYDSPEVQPGVDAPTTNAAPPAESAPGELEVIPFTPTLRRAVQAGYGVDAPLVLHLGSLVCVRRQEDGTFVQPPIEVGVLGASIPDDYEGRIFELDANLATSTVVEPGAHEDATLGK